MRRAVVLLAAAGVLASTACTPNVTTGRPCTPELIANEIPCIPTDVPSTIATSRSPVVTPPPPRVTTPPPRTSVPPAPQGRTYTIQIRSSADGYEPRERRLYVGDTIVFTNRDPNSKHSFTGDKGEWDSGELAEGQSYTLKVRLAPGRYTFRCTVVPYVLGGPIEVLRA